MMPSRSRLESWRVSTHSRLEAADRAFRAPPRGSEVSTHSRLEAAESVQFMKLVFEPVSTHSRLEAAEPCAKGVSRRMNCFNTQPPRGG